MNPLALLIIILGVLLMIIGIKGSYGNFMAAIKELLCQMFLMFPVS